MYLGRTPPPWTRGLLPDSSPDDPDDGSRLPQAFSQITAWLTAIPGLRFQARRKVVDYWQGADVLECGHVRHNPHTTAYQPWSRPCLFCEAQAARRTFRATGDTAVLDWFATLTGDERGRLIADWHGRQDTSQVPDLGE